LPYLLNKPYAALGSRVGFIFGSIASISLVFAFFMVPNVAGYSLEEIDNLFESDVPIRRWTSAGANTITLAGDGGDSEDVEEVHPKSSGAPHRPK
jgi:SP family sugar:H+ symporter-like MFS transporter